MPDLTFAPQTELTLFSLIITLLCGALFGFFGYRFLRISMSVSAFISFASLNTYVRDWVDMPAFLYIIVTIALGLLGAFLAFKLFKFGVFVLCGAAGGMIGAMWLSNTLWIIVLALSCGILGLCLMKPIIVLVTSGAGAAAIAGGIATYFHLGNVTAHISWLMALAVVLFVICTVTQFSTTKGVIRK
nr:DUF4203 domain-containing protein [Maliibacterium massiliense]